MQRRLRGSIMLLIAALIWGTAFVAQSEGMRYVEPFTYNAIRTLIGGIVLIPIILIFKRIRRKDGDTSETSLKTTIIGGIVCGIFLFIASSFQQSGISMTTAGKAGFITALYIIIVPLFGLFFHRKVSPILWLCVLIAAAGFWMLCIKEGFTIGKGDLLVLCCAVFFAMHIMSIDHFNGKHVDAMLMSCIQFFTAGTLMAICMFLFETPHISNILDAKVTILYAGFMSSGVAFTLQIIGQKDTEPTVATLLMSLESVFAALSGWLILHEALTLKELVGCILVFSAVIFAQLKSSGNTDNKKDENLKMEMKYEKTS